MKDKVISKNNSSISNYNTSIKDKEHKIVNFYKAIKELNGSQQLQKSKPIKRTRKNLNSIGLKKNMDNMNGGHVNKDVETKDVEITTLSKRFENDYSYNSITNNNNNNNNFVVWD